MRFLPFFGCLFIARVNNVLIDLIVDDSYKLRIYNYVIHPKKESKETDFRRIQCEVAEAGFQISALKSDFDRHRAPSRAAVI